MTWKLGSRARALARVWRLAGWGANARSRGLLAVVALLTQLDPGRHPNLTAKLHELMQAAGGPDGRIAITLRDLEGKRHRFAFRALSSDYQSIFECFVQDMYDWSLAIARGVTAVVDCGAHIGCFVAACKCRFPTLRVLALEPDSLNYELLLENAAGFEGVECVHAAVWSRDTPLPFDQRGTNESRVIEDAPSNPESTHDVVAVSGRDVVGLLAAGCSAAHTWLKLDVEGAEYRVLPRLLESGILPTVLSVEIHDFLGRGGERLWRDMENAGYEGRLHGFGTSGYVCRQVTASTRPRATAHTLPRSSRLAGGA